MHIATIVPVNHLSLVKSNYYHLILVHVLQQSTTYAEFYKEQIKDGKFVILDNGAAEGNQATIEDLYHMAVDLKVSELQLPDIYLDKNATLKATYEGLEFLQKKCYSGKIMAVPQGKTFEEWLDCANDMLEWPIHTIGVPKNLTKSAGPRGRAMAIHYLQNVKHTHKELHLLGCWEDPREIHEIDLAYNIRGVDSSIAYLYALNGLPLDPRKHSKPVDPLDLLWELRDDSLLRANIQRWEDYCNGKLR